VLLIPEDVGFSTALTVSAITAMAAAVVEAVSPWGIDNLTVPASSVVILLLLL
jgi:dolichol kinase